MQHHNYSLTEIEQMMPWEREIYVALLMQYLEDEKMRERQRAAENRNKQTQGENYGREEDSYR